MDVVLSHAPSKEDSAHEWWFSIYKAFCLRHIKPASSVRRETATLRVTHEGEPHCQLKPWTWAFPLTR